MPEIEVETYWTNLYCRAETVVALYHDHGTSEQFHSELKSDLNVERLPDRSARRRNHPRLRTPQPLVQDHRANRPNVRITKPPSYPGKPQRGGSGLPSRKEISGKTVKSSSIPAKTRKSPHENPAKQRQP